MLSDSKIRPLVYEISKIEDTFPCGATKFTLKQDHYNPATDNPELGVCDYYESPAVPEENMEEKFSLKYSGTKPILRVGGSSRIISIDSEFDISNITWSYLFDNNSYISSNDFEIKEYPTYVDICAKKNFNNLGKIITITAKNKHYEDSLSLEVVR